MSQNISYLLFITLFLFKLVSLYTYIHALTTLFLYMFEVAGSTLMNTKTKELRRKRNKKKKSIGKVVV